VSCRALGVPQSWFCKWQDGELPPRAARRERLKAETARLFAERGGRDGSPRVTAALRDAGWRVSENTVAALVREQGLATRRNKRRKAATRPGKGRWRAPDQVKRKFAVSGINRRWYGDGTEIVTGEGKLYLDSVLDMGSRRIAGHALGAHHDAALAFPGATQVVDLFHAREHVHDLDLAGAGAGDVRGGTAPCPPARPGTTRTVAAWALLAQLLSLW
jgi:hypothetical protein